MHWYAKPEAAVTKTLRRVKLADFILITPIYLHYVKYFMESIVLHLEVQFLSDFFLLKAQYAKKLS